MEDHFMDTPFTHKESTTVPGRNLIEQLSPASPLSNQKCWEMGLPVLAAQCLRELNNYRQGEPCTDIYGLELLRRAIKQSDQEAWVWVQHCFSGLVRGWLHRHPQRELACSLESEENYITIGASLQ